MTSTPLVDETAAAKQLGVTVSFLRKDRSKRRTIPFLKLGGKLVRYDIDRVRAALTQFEQGGAVR